MDKKQKSLRYAIHDSYIIEEMRGRYLSSSPKDRLRFLQQLQEESFFTYDQLPFEVAILTVKDTDPIIRNWIARNGRYLDYREIVSFDKQQNESPLKYRFPDRNLWEILSHDRDPFVRTAVLENPHNPSIQFSFSSKKIFPSLSGVERLAFIRNPKLSVGVDYIDPLIFQLLDLSDNTYSLSDDERKELLLAFLSHYVEIQRDTPETAKMSSEQKKLWGAISKFSIYPVKEFAYRHLVGKDEWKAEAYKAEQFPDLRMILLANTNPADERTIKLGMEDENSNCQEMALSKYVEPVKEPNKYWRMLKHLWTGIVNLVVLLVVVAIFSFAHTPFERLVIVGLVYIYVRVTFSDSAFGRFSQLLFVGLNNEFRRLRQIAGETLTELQKIEDERERNAIDEQWSKVNIDFYIEMVFQSLMILVALYNLFAVLI
jgi:hypothetical protein